MRRVFCGMIAVAMVFGLARQVIADDSPQTVIDEAVKAYGGKDKLDKLKAVRVQGKGTLEVLGQTVPFTKETISQNFDQFKEVMQLEIMGQKVTQTTLYNKGTAALSANGMEINLDDKLQNEFKETIHLMQFSKLYPLKGKEFKLTPLGEIKVNDRPAVGIKVSSEGYRDVNLYFDKGTHLMAKMEMRAYDATAGKEVDEERFMTEYLDVDGLKMAKKVTLNRDGKKLLDIEVTDVKLVDKIDDSEFSK